MGMTRCPQCLNDSLIQDCVNLLHPRCSRQDCECIVIPGTAGPKRNCETCGRRKCQFRAAGASFADCGKWLRKLVRKSVFEPDLFDVVDAD